MAEGSVRQCEVCYQPIPAEQAPVRVGSCEFPFDVHQECVGDMAQVAEFVEELCELSDEQPEGLLNLGGWGVDADPGGDAGPPGAGAADLGGAGAGGGDLDIPGPGGAGLSEMDPAAGYVGMDPTAGYGGMDPAAGDAGADPAAGFGGAEPPAPAGEGDAAAATALLAAYFDGEALPQHGPLNLENDAVYLHAWWPATIQLQPGVHLVRSEPDPPGMGVPELVADCLTQRGLRRCEIDDRLLESIALQRVGLLGGSWEVWAADDEAAMEAVAAAAAG